MGFTHWMEVDDQTDDAVVFSCPEPGCGRRVVVGGDSGLLVVDQGDFHARHVGAVGPIGLDASIAGIA
ncbi:MAG TPA: hypothetical protein VLG28_06690 [Acidimicrobiia bacterium]|jgi:hypothetical protein|nr:hypothetical protein [Acidimicrobiia bacterium]